MKTLFNLFIIYLFFGLIACTTQIVYESEDNIYRPENWISLEKALQEDPDKITELEMENYRDTVFPNQHILKFKNLQKLSVKCRGTDTEKFNGFGPLPLYIDTTGLKQLNGLIHLELVGFDLRQFPVELFDLNQLRSLAIALCGLDSLPEEISKLKNLEILELRINNLSSLPFSLKSMDSLKTLDLGNNNFNHIPSIVTEIKNLQSLIMSNPERSVAEAGNTCLECYFGIKNNRITTKENISVMSSLFHSSSFRKLSVNLPTCDDVMIMKNNFPAQIKSGRVTYNCSGCSTSCPYYYGNK